MENSIPSILANPQDILDVSYDLPVFDGRARRYVVATTQRSGSTKFCLDLWGTGALGAPWEYFNLPFMTPLFRRFGTPTLPAYAAALVRHRTTPNGVFGHKMFMASYALADFAVQGMAELVLPDCVVFLRRRDKLAQARSLARAMASQRWVGTADGAPSAPDADAERAALRYLCWQEALWERRFAERGIVPLRLWFEDHLADRTASVARMLDHVGVTAAEARLPVPETVIQSHPEERAVSPAFDVDQALTAPFSREELRRFMREMAPIA